MPERSLRRRAQLRVRKPLRRTTPLERRASLAASDVQRATVDGRDAVVALLHTFRLRRSAMVASMREIGGPMKLRGDLRLPRTKRGAALALGGGVVVVAVAGFVFIYFVLFPTSSPKPFSLTSRRLRPVSSGTRSPADGRSPPARWRATASARSSDSSQPR